MNRTARGFSIIEIVIVITIIGILAAATFGGLRWLQKAKLTTTETKLAALDTMIEQYNTTIGEYPTELRELAEGPSKQNLQKRWQEPIAAEDDLSDGWKQPFIYSLSPKGTRPPYELYSIGSTGNAKIFSPRSKE
jgi:general secretion pathway protein G